MFSQLKTLRFSLFYPGDWHRRAADGAIAFAIQAVEPE
jgi:hypothetical protein